MPVASPDPKPCVRVILTADSIFVGVTQRACQDIQRGDTVMVWRIPSRHRSCDGRLQADMTTGELHTEWQACRDTAVWFDTRPIIQRVGL